MEKLIKIVMLISTLAILSGCVSEPIYYSESMIQSEGARISAIHKHLLAYQVRIFQNDDSMLIFLPSKTFFNNNSANFSMSSFQALDLIVEYLGYYEISTVSIIGFAGVPMKEMDNKLLARERAQKVMHYLWSRNIDASMVYSDGKDMAKTLRGKILLSDCVLINFRKLAKE